ncbi:MAG: hypothetical protein P4L44_06890 [Oryzomonas sp.]|uniref:hypothetical protein n=1 Tax=Oryzomonas sp. TaxID=2855186 RepID=UPI00284A70AD|nr:hypothetical protein [Oryzomonas sp.]MDR3579669.1 hypothetical protein [Oryzomonas sp.]
MPDLLFISDKPKVEQIRDLLQPMLKLEIGVTADVERAMKDVLNHPPSVICIQEQVAGTTAEEIVRQILTIPENGTPLFVLLREGDDTAVPPEQLFTHVIDLNLPVEQLVKSILRAVLQPALKLRWSEIYTSREQDWPAVSLHEETEPDGAPAAPTKSQIPAELLKAFEHNYRSRHRDRWLKYATVSLTACLAVFAWHLTSRRHDQIGTISHTLSARPATQQPAVTPVSPTKKNTPTTPPSSAAIVQMVPAAAPVPPAKKSTPTPAPSSAAIVQKAPATPRKPVAGTAKTFKLPSFIPKKGRDSAYSRQKPGWERYTDSTREFRILRSGNRIKAVQVLATTPDTISQPFLKSVLGEISGTNTYRETSQKEEHGFLVKRGSAGPGVKILIYTQKSRIRAFVISIS